MSGPTSVLNKQKKQPKKKEKKSILTDLSIQGTNDSSIVSKRSVERLYWKRQNTGEFLKFFVAKPIRRSPVINRGYWTRVRALKHIIDTCLARNRTSQKNLVVVNLGCGFDPYPFQYLHQTPETNNITFLDVDYPDLMRRKSNIIKNTKEILDIIGDYEYHESSPSPTEPIIQPDPKTSSTKPTTEANPLILTSQKYVALSCDLRNLDKFSSILNSLHPFESNSFLFTAEVSLTYMDNTSADNLIKWASTLPESDFALLEQLVPAGPEHPFAKTMLRHFNSLGTPLHSVLTYPRQQDQHERFASRGWKKVGVENLYQFWENHVAKEEKEFVQSVEDFDELEEFIIFCQHYFILHASTSNDADLGVSSEPTVNHDRSKSSSLTVVAKKPGNTSKARFSAGSQFNSSSVVFHGGITTRRLNNMGLISTSHESDQLIEKPNNLIEPRMCHTLTRLTDGSLLLVGGRLNPSKSLGDCWLLKGSCWTEVQKLPSPRFRHSTVAVDDENILLFGGSSDPTETAFLLWNSKDGWKQLPSDIQSRYSSAISWETESKCGYIIGGLNQKGEIVSDCVKFTFEGEKVVTEKLIEHPLLRRYGSKSIIFEGSIILAGGVSSTELIEKSNFFAIIDIASKTVVPRECKLQGLEDSPDMPMPVGFNFDLIDENSALIYGGGAVCFSFGLFSNEIYEVQLKGTDQVKQLYTQGSVLPHVQSRSYPTEIHRSNDVSSEAHFKGCCRKEVPFVMTNVHFGNTTEWSNPEHIISAIGGERKVVVHKSDSKNLNFQEKNFKYETMAFREFIGYMFSGLHNIYLRSISEENPRNKAAVFSKDFPVLSKEFQLPEFLQGIQENHFSSPLRMSSANTSIWLHYDVTANILCQVVGEKRVRMYPPTDVQYLNFPAGASSSTIPDIFEHKSDDRCHPIEFTMVPGDVLYIPPMWLHGMKPLSPSISVNFFYKDLPEKDYSSGRDVYGNRDLASYENGRKQVANIVQSMQELPEEIRRFYLLRLGDELKQHV